ncbi:phospho-N-acetylmuramoyl-pentapeptide-transferase [Phormidesmis priestleyi]|uniref:phospho-N-acetylmuramoyl-pentapeptide- transferase n=1 Tax=Phormidesmis priestleyi TaxID=268141 RepID=UPI00083AC557|nr:phospho-N-acetylmuramoyl-pentapeptide-transferase [Phormidesmis priestleyi]
MDAKLFTDRSFSFSGTRLFLFLTIGLTVAAIALDAVAGRPFHQVASLTLPLWASALATAGVGFWAVPLLKALKAGQVIREDGPQSHLKKAGTPTMGGAFFVPVAVAFALVLSGFSANVVAVSALTLAYALVGFIDDWQIIRYKSNKGISPRLKLGLQVFFAVAFCVWLYVSHPVSITTLALPLGLTLPLGVLFWVLAAFTLVAESNATNLTDGMDGLAGGTVAIALLGLGALIGTSSPDLMIFCVSMSGGCLGFLVHNRNPARVFMGDTGSLALGGGLAAVALITNSLFALLILSGLFFLETLSVIAQVGYYKATKDSNGIGKRLFKMSPFHNHLELTGWTETQVVGWFYVIAAVLAVLGLTIR